MFPSKLNHAKAFDLAQAMLDGFDRHYRLFRQTSAAAKKRFEDADWHAQQKAQRERIEFYDERVGEALDTLQKKFKAAELSMEVWHQVKLHYIGLLTNHHQPELAETFFNSVTTKILHRHYFHNDFIFVRPAVSTEYIDDNSTFESHYPVLAQFFQTWLNIIQKFSLQRPFENLHRDVRYVIKAVETELDGHPSRDPLQVQVLRSLFFRNKGAYVVGKLIYGHKETPFALPILHNEKGQLVIDAMLFGEEDLLKLFSFARAYFMVEMEVPSAYVQFLCSLMPRKPRAEIYSALGLQKHGKTLFYRDFLAHLFSSTDQFRISEGIKGMVMLVFDLPSFPYVFKVIKDFYPAPKETSRELIKSKYILVKQHDRVGRMADTLEYSNVAFPYSRFSRDLIEELRHFAPSQIEIPGHDANGVEVIVLKHVYIERRMVPLNLYLQEANPEQMHHAVIDYGNAIKDLVAANIFPGDMLWKNFGFTQHGKVVFYDYDEIEYLSDCHFRTLPTPRNEEEEMSADIWYNVGPRDVFPQSFGPFLLGHSVVREIFMKHHADLLDASFWKKHQMQALAGHVHDVFPYEASKRFRFQPHCCSLEHGCEAPVKGGQ